MINREFQATHYFTVLMGLLRDRQGFMEEIRQGVRLPSKIISLLVCSSLFFAVYGAIIGSSHSSLQALSSAFKLPCFYLMTLILCLPTLYFFSILSGSTRSIGQYFAMLLTSVAVISVLEFSLAPVVLFFLITTHNYQFFVLLNVAIFALTGFTGVTFLYQGVQLMSVQDNEAAQDTRTRILQFWLILYALVGCQLGWTLRPFFGTPGEFVLFRAMEGNFYLSILKAIGELLGFN
ncbi:actin-binding WH2 domain-containing protein [Coleofasciculus sp. FACHB-1120]|uniref:actin-binding WH2 domain-containing protein n=1 Tax=Coleofasciculus sp. FACHB-1120 TaxID=2692783 RepID=UPI0016883B3E|nr:actin-binding WH2 domain-containing protein [Coleofasciculus sp. FACHB-1120]MBD2742975.1 actin-binding WH2 domain-containing protein [Coleofasciculus sp. FACHB-1120]